MLIEDLLEFTAQKPFFVWYFISIVGDNVLQLGGKVLHHSQEDLVLLGIRFVIHWHFL